MVNRHNNIARIRVIARALAELNQKVVFVGGAVVDLYADDPARGEVRPTEDVDVVIEVINRAEYATVEEKLRQIGFQNMMMSEVICRYTYQGIIVDIMPNDDEILHQLIRKDRILTIWRRFLYFFKLKSSY